LQTPANELRKLALLLVAVAIAAYALWCLTADDLVMPYRWWGSGSGIRSTRLLHLHGLWAIGGSICLLLSAAGFVILFFEAFRAQPNARHGTGASRYLAGGLILVGCLFTSGVSVLTHWFVR